MGDSDGEWIELFNAGDVPVNLRGWSLSDLGTDQHVIATDLVIQPGAYLVLGRNADTSVNGGVDVDYVYAGLSLANGDDEIVLAVPGGREADRVVWGDELSASRGASLARSAFPDGAWLPSPQPWPGSAGDRGTPGSE